MILVEVYDNDIERAIKTWKKKLNKEGITDEMMRRVNYVKPFESRRYKLMRSAKHRRRSGFN